MWIAFGVLGLWLLLITFALIGHNTRQAILQQQVRALRTTSITPQRQSGFVEATENEKRSDLEPGSAVLLVSETCLGCNQAIESARQYVLGGSPGSFSPLYVLTPNPGDGRIVRPLVRLHDDELYRSIYPGAAPALFVVGEGGSLTLVPQGSEPLNVQDSLDGELGSQRPASPIQDVIRNVASQPGSLPNTQEDIAR